ncbi:MAG: AMIN domain-containing protein [Oceanicaulis sp.]
MLRLLTSLLGATLVAAAAGPAARADQVTAVRFGAHPDKTRIVVETSAPVQARIFTLDGPAERLVIELPRGAGFSVPGLDGRGRSTVPGVSSFVFDDRAEAPRLIFHLDGPNAVRAGVRIQPRRRYGRPAHPAGARARRVGAAAGGAGAELRGGARGDRSRPWRPRSGGAGPLRWRS